MPRVDKTLVATILLLAGLGVLALWMHAPPADFSRASLVKSSALRQIVFLGAALALMGLAALPHYNLFRQLAWVFYAAGLVALVVLLLKGNRTRGAAGWFSLGPVNVQPAEFFKIALVFTLGRILMYGRAVQTWSGLALPVAATAVPAVLVLLQPDLGTTLLFVPTLFAMLYVAGARKRHLAIMASVLLVAAPVVFFKVMKPYQQARLTAFWTGKDNYQADQAVKACASGRAFGRALSENGAQLPYYVPDRSTDFVYSILAEELGFFGSTFVLLLYAAFFAQCLRVAHQSREPFARLVVTGLTVCFAAQTFINLGMTLGVAPITGLTLPFVSYGGSSLLTCALAAGVVLNVGARWQPAFSARDMAGGSIAISGFQPQAVKWLNQ
ncbi:MAG TPA: FtsW/RodA/SpoVE family cell cycle protein [Planctomycetota bacterium]